MGVGGYVPGQVHAPLSDPPCAPLSPGALPTQVRSGEKMGMDQGQLWADHRVLNDYLASAVSACKSVERDVEILHVRTYSYVHVCVRHMHVCMYVHMYVCASRASIFVHACVCASRAFIYVHGCMCI